MKTRVVLIVVMLVAAGGSGLARMAGRPSAPRAHGEFSGRFQPAVPAVQYQRMPEGGERGVRHAEHISSS